MVFFNTINYPQSQGFFSACCSCMYADAQRENIRALLNLSDVLLEIA